MAAQEMRDLTKKAAHHTRGTRHKAKKTLPTAGTSSTLAAAMGGRLRQAFCRGCRWEAISAGMGCLCFHACTPHPCAVLKSASAISPLPIPLTQPPHSFDPASPPPPHFQNMLKGRKSSTDKIEVQGVTEATLQQAAQAMEGFSGEGRRQRGHLPACLRPLLPAPCSSAMASLRLRAHLPCLASSAPPLLTWGTLAHTPHTWHVTTPRTRHAGREIAKFMAAVQAAVYGGQQAVLTPQLFDAVLKRKLYEHNERAAFR